MKRVTVLMLCMALILYSSCICATASSSRYTHFRVILQPESFACLGPGDVLETSFVIQNNSHKSVKVRLCQVNNLISSPLFRVFRVKWQGDHETEYGHFDDLLTDWMEIPTEASKVLPLELYFPKELGNAYQNQNLHVEFVFLCQGDEKDVQIGQSSVEPAPVTEDANQIERYLFVCCLALVVMRRLSDEQ